MSNTLHQLCHGVSFFFTKKFYESFVRRVVEKGEWLCKGDGCVKMLMKGFL